MARRYGMVNPEEEPLSSIVQCRVKPESIVRYVNVYKDISIGGEHSDIDSVRATASAGGRGNLAGHIKYTVTDGKLTDVEIVE